MRCHDSRWCRTHRRYDAARVHELLSERGAVTKVDKRPKTKKPDVNWDEFPNTVRQFLACKKQSSFLEDRIDKLKKQINDIVDDNGEADEGGHIRLGLEKPVDGIGALKRERRVSTKLDEERAEKILRRKGLYNRCARKVIVLDEEEIAKVTFEGKLTAKEFDSMFEETITWALIPQKAT